MPRAWLDERPAGCRRSASSAVRARTRRARRPPAAAARWTGCSARSSGARRGWPTCHRTLVHEPVVPVVDEVPADDGADGGGHAGAEVALVALPEPLGGGPARPTRCWRRARRRRRRWRRPTRRCGGPGCGGPCGRWRRRWRRRHRSGRSRSGPRRRPCRRPSRSWRPRPTGGCRRAGSCPPAASRLARTSAMVVIAAAPMAVATRALPYLPRPGVTGCTSRFSVSGARRLPTPMARLARCRPSCSRPRWARGPAPAS